jgi:hypothetical protein
MSEEVEMETKKEQYKFLLQIRYKSGHMIEEWFKSFEVNGPVVRWELFGPKKFIIIGYNDIESVLQIDQQKV